MERDCDGKSGPCHQLVALLDSAERIAKAKVRNGSVNVKALQKWLEAKQNLCPDCPGKKAHGAAKLLSSGGGTKHR